MDPLRHRKWVGVDNEVILKNLLKAYEAFPDKRFVARSPIIPGVNDTEEHVEAVLSFVKPYRNVVAFELLPYHRLGEGKYGYLGKVYALKDFTPPDPERLRKLRDLVAEAFKNREP